RRRRPRRGWHGARLSREAPGRQLDQRRLLLLRTGGLRLPARRQRPRARAARAAGGRRGAPGVPPPRLLGLHGHLQGRGAPQRSLGVGSPALAGLERGAGPIRALVTGARGFVASWLARALLDAGSDVSSLDLQGAAPS